MATKTLIVARSENRTCVIEMDYDDVTLAVSAISIKNSSKRKVSISTDKGAVLVSSAIASIEKALPTSGRDMITAIKENKVDLSSATRTSIQVPFNISWS